MRLSPPPTPPQRTRCAPPSHTPPTPQPSAMRLCVVDYPPLAIAPVLFRIMFEARRELSCVMCESSPATFSCACETREGGRETDEAAPAQALRVPPQPAMDAFDGGSMVRMAKPLRMLGAGRLRARVWTRTLRVRQRAEAGDRRGLEASPSLRLVPILPPATSCPHPPAAFLSSLVGVTGVCSAVFSFCSVVCSHGVQCVFGQ